MSRVLPTLSGTRGVDIDVINYATRYTTTMKAKFPTVKKSSLKGNPDVK